MKHIGFKIDVIETGKTEGWLEVGEIHHQQFGIIHGGVTVSIADIVAGFAAYTLVPEDHHVVTAELKITYFSPGIGDRLHAIGYVVKQGKKLNFCEAQVWSEKGDKKSLIAKVSTTMAIIFPEDFKKKDKT